MATQPPSALLGTDVPTLLAGTAEINRWANANPSKSLDLRCAELDALDLSGALLRRADLSHTKFTRCNFSGANFDQSILSGAKFVSCNLERATFRNVKLCLVRIDRCVLDGANFQGSCHFSEIDELESCVINDSHSDVSIELSQCRFIDRLLNWAHIRTVGQLRLFLPSYVGLFASIVVLSSIAFINNYMQAGHDALGDLIERGIFKGALAERLLHIAEPLRPSWRHFAVLGSALALATGATLYLLCPSRIREFTLDQWKYVAKRPVFEYHVSSWNKPRTRLSCVIAYGIGGALALALLIDTLFHLFLLLWQGLTH
jgi:hypothetical protein